ncbi:hypothetical protein FS842_003633 [Serendipita sp. 407]|nr:hypothetical protein FS842_003633 [Serendipita sp. 407]
MMIPSTAPCLLLLRCAFFRRLEPRTFAAVAFRYNCLPSAAEEPDSSSKSLVSPYMGDHSAPAPRPMVDLVAAASIAELGQVRLRGKPRLAVEEEEEGIDPSDTELRDL